MFEQLIELDKSLFLILNGFHSPFFDQVMVILSARAPWIPLYVAIALSLFFSFKWEISDKLPKPKFQIIKRSFRYGLIAILGIILTFALTEMVSNQIKFLVERPRPAYDPIIGAMVRLLEYKGGLYGFLSNHTANVFGLATLTSLIFKRRYYTVPIYFWAVMVSYSRVYVGKHYPLDIICGAILGILIGWGVYLLIKALLKRFNLIHGKPYVLHN